MRLEKYTIDPDYKTCPACHGSGVQYSNKSGMREECPMCEGEGKIMTKEARRKHAQKGNIW